MGKRLDLHQILLTMGTTNVYFQPPPEHKMQYPAIVYKRDYSHRKMADNLLYGHQKRYSVTVIDRNPDSEIPDKVERLPLTSFDRHFQTSGLNHTIFNIYF